MSQEYDYSLGMAAVWLLGLVLVAAIVGAGLLWYRKSRPRRRAVYGEFTHRYRALRAIVEETVPELGEGTSLLEWADDPETVKDRRAALDQGRLDELALRLMAEQTNLWEAISAMDRVAPRRLAFEAKQSVLPLIQFTRELFEVIRDPNLPIPRSLTEWTAQAHDKSIEELARHMKEDLRRW
jgi:hypothetical protein